MAFFVLQTLQDLNHLITIFYNCLWVKEEREREKKLIQKKYLQGKLKPNHSKKNRNNRNKKYRKHELMAYLDDTVTETLLKVFPGVLLIACILSVVSSVCPSVRLSYCLEMFIEVYFANWWIIKCNGTGFAWIISIAMEEEFHLHQKVKL